MTHPTRHEDPYTSTRLASKLTPSQAHALIYRSPDRRWSIFTGCRRRMTHPTRHKDPYTSTWLASKLTPSQAHALLYRSPDRRWSIFTGCWRRMTHPTRHKDPYTSTWLTSYLTPPPPPPPRHMHSYTGHLTEDEASLQVVGEGWHILPDTRTHTQVHG